MIPAFCKPMNATNSPMPAAMAFFKLGLTASSMRSRKPVSVSKRNNTPE